MSARDAARIYGDQAYGVDEVEWREHGRRCLASKFLRSDGCFATGSAARSVTLGISCNDSPASQTKTRKAKEI
jgi:hypothetical protein